jgi:hypothetical protein
MGAFPVSTWPLMSAARVDSANSKLEATIAASIAIDFRIGDLAFMWFSLLQMSAANL